MDNQFETIIGRIDGGFQPENIANENDAEQQLMQFLNLRFPNIVMRPGHTATGLRIDIVIEGTFAIELVTVDSESRLVTLMHQIVQSKEDFTRIAVVLVDLGKIPFDKIQNYIDEYKKLESSIAQINANISRQLQILEDRIESNRKLIDDIDRRRSYPRYYYYRRSPRFEDEE